METVRKKNLKHFKKLIATENNFLDCFIFQPIASHFLIILCLKIALYYKYFIIFKIIGKKFIYLIGFL